MIDLMVNILAILGGLLIALYIINIVGVISGA
jgi:hypothetical protein